MKIRILIVVFLVFISCKKEIEEESEKVQNKEYYTVEKRETEVENIDTIETFKKYKTNKILCDLDGDNLNEIVEIVRGKKNGKSGLRIIFGNGNRTDYFGMGNNILEQGFDELDWAGIFEKAPKDGIYWNNVNEEGEILSEEEIKETDKIKLLNDWDIHTRRRKLRRRNNIS
ncbi:hypothetical protein [Flavobacterium aquicola]|uniref:Uncharacterized protein n=1 Tax=Flavobacterium aquicola TaxID=1682742 RepID=A0A3E0EQE5_9FLAO|nr:hypothetical protein [Flavobacterium aquicola]REH00443.1 hypothetical protein C8P67_103429 [Flavobacterium aquicola]